MELKDQTTSGFLTEALRLVEGDRARTHGDKLQNFENLATMWNAYLKIRGFNVELRASDAAEMMSYSKKVRKVGGEYNPDDYVDDSAYSAIAGECRRAEITASWIDA